ASTSCASGPAPSLEWCSPLDDLLSFPTRRSSDLLARLGVAVGPGLGGGRTGRVGGRAGSGQLVLQPVQGLRRRFGLQGLGQGRRSEEHTSELQSRENLVCRLLLEKKKYQHHHCTH